MKAGFLTPPLTDGRKECEWDTFIRSVFFLPDATAFLIDRVDMTREAIPYAFFSVLDYADVSCVNLPAIKLAPPLNTPADPDML